MKKLILLFITLLASLLGFAQIEHTNSPPMDANEMAQKLVGKGIEVFNAKLLCGDNGSGYFWNGGTTNLGIESGIVLTTGTTEIAFSPNDRGDASGGGGPGFAPLEDVGGTIHIHTFNACVLEFDFIAQSNEVYLNYVFGSEEYPEWVGSPLTDVFVILIEGLPQYPPEMPFLQRNIATIPGSPDPGVHVAINFLNANSYSEYYQDNTDNPHLQYDGQTVRLSAKATVTPLNTYHLTLAVADNSDAIYDSGLFFEEGSFSANILQLESTVSSNIGGNSQTITEGCSEGIVTFSINNIHIPSEGLKVPVVTSTNPNVNGYLIALGGTAKIFEDYEISHSELIIFPPDSQNPLSTEKFTEQWIITPIADGLEEELEYITLGIYSGYADDYLSIDTLWLEDEQTTSIVYNEETLCPGESIQLEVIGVEEGMTLEWNPAISLDNPNIPNPIASPTETTTYTVTITDEGGSQTPCAVTIWVDDSFIVDVVSSTQNICLGGFSSLILLDYNPDVNYTFFDEEGNIVAEATNNITVLEPTQTTTYQLIATNQLGCTATDEITIKVQDFQIEVKELFVVCEGENLQINPNVSHEALAYQWVPSTGMDNPNILNPVFTLIETTTYTLRSISTSSCITEKEINIKVLKDCVFPADTDNNGLVNMFDLFPLGQHFGKQGPARNNISNDWQGFGVEDWSETQSNGQNLKYADCNGNGIIGFEDITAIVQNFELQQKNIDFTKGKLGDPELQFVPNFETIGLNEWLDLEVWMGSEENPVTDLYAIAFETFVDVSLIDINTFSIDYSQSQLGTVGEDLLAVGWINKQNGLINVSLSNNSIGISGQVHLFTIRMKSKANLENPENLQFEITNFGATTSNEAPILANLDELPTISIDPEIVNIETTASQPKPYSFFPSFTQDGFRLQYSLRQNPNLKVKLFDLSGQFMGVLWRHASSNVGSFEQYIDLTEWNLAAGVYILELEVEGIVYQEKIVRY